MCEDRALYQPFLLTVEETITGMEQGNVIDVLYVALGKMRVEGELVAEEVKRIQRLSLGLRDGRDFGVARELSKPDEIPMTRCTLARAA